MEQQKEQSRGWAVVGYYAHYFVEGLHSLCGAAKAEGWVQLAEADAPAVPADRTCELCRRLLKAERYREVQELLGCPGAGWRFTADLLRALATQQVDLVLRVVRSEQRVPEFAAELFDAYREHLGGIAKDGKAIPAWEAIKDAPQGRGWLEVARRALLARTKDEAVHILYEPNRASWCGLEHGRFGSVDDATCRSCLSEMAWTTGRANAQTRLADLGRIPMAREKPSQEVLGQDQREAWDLQPAAPGGRRPARIYVASSWRNTHQPAVVERLRREGFEVYDFRNPPSRTGFSWSLVDPAWKAWTPEDFRKALEHPISKAGFKSDMDALRDADACVLVMPSGRSAHLEAGWAAGAGRKVIVYQPEPAEAELMVLMTEGIATTLEEVVERLRGEPLAEVANG